MRRKSNPVKNFKSKYFKNLYKNPLTWRKTNLYDFNRGRYYRAPVNDTVRRKFRYRVFK